MIALAPRRCAFVLPSLAGGGAERVALLLAGALAELGAHESSGWRVQLVVLERRGPLFDLIPAGVEPIVLGHARLRASLSALYRHPAIRDADVLVSTFAHVTVALAALRPWLPRRPVLIAREPNLPSLSLRSRGIDRWLRLGCRLAYPRCELVLATSRRMAAELQRDFAVPAARLRILDNPVDEQRVRAAAGRAVDTPSGRLFVAAGRMVPQKGFDRLLTLWRETPDDYHLVLLGDGPQRQALEAMVSDLRLTARVRLIGFTANPWAWYARADALLLSSRFEGMPNVALEALACGTPVVATPESGGVAEVRDGDGGAKDLHIAPFGAHYLHRILSLPSLPGPYPRPSLLPRRHRREEVARRFVDLLHGATGGLLAGS